MDKKQQYLTPEAEEVLICPAEHLLNAVSTQGFTEDEAFDNSGFVLG